MARCKATTGVSGNKKQCKHNAVLSGLCMSHYLANNRKEAKIKGYMIERYGRINLD